MQAELAKVQGVTVLIHDQPCAAELRRARKRGKAPEPAEAIFIDERVCEGCGDCGTKSNCLSVMPVETEFGRKTEIHQASCNKDYSCVKGDCPSFLEVVAAEGRDRPRPRRPREPPSDLPEPVLRVPRDDFVMRMPGVGGTGVVTVSQIIGDGRDARRQVHVGPGSDGAVAEGRPGDLRRAHRARPDRGLEQGVGRLDRPDAGLRPARRGEPEEPADRGPVRTVAVVSTTKVPTASMVTDTGVRFPALERNLDAIRRPRAPTSSTRSTHSRSARRCSATTCRPTRC